MNEELSPRSGAADAVLPAYQLAGTNLLLVWCRWCRRWHQHGLAGGDGHRAAHCARPGGPYRRGYVLQMRSEITRQQAADWQRRARRAACARPPQVHRRAEPRP